MVSNVALHNLPISARPSLSWRQRLIATIFFFVFNFGAIMVNASQFVFLLPLRILPFRWSNALYEMGIRYTKGAFGCLIILMCQWFAPSTLMITFETEGQGAFTQDEIDRVAVRDSSGNVVSLDLPTKFVMIANHQVYLDWWYAWCLMYYVGKRGVHQHIYITLKKSLQWLPIVGWGMQFFGFIFLARSWASDRLQLASRLSALGKEAQSDDNPFAFLLYPEGTLVSKDTRPISRKFADKMGISDMTNTLLPRSTGLHYSLRSLVPRIPQLRLIDLTVVYPGIPAMKYGQDYYTMRSVFFDGVPPPTIHIHLRMFNVATDVPIGDISASDPAAPPDPSPSQRTVEVDMPEDEKDRFDLWLRELWQEKDESIGRFLETESFSSSPQKSMEIPLRLRQKRETLDAFCFFLPAAIGCLWRRLRQ